MGKTENSTGSDHRVTSNSENGERLEGREDREGRLDVRQRGSASPAAQNEANADHQQQDNDRRLELLALGRIAHAMRSFVECAEFELQRWSRSRSKLSEKHKELLESLSSPTIYADDCQKFIREGVHHNDMFLRAVLEWANEQGGPWPLNTALQAADMWVDENGNGVTPADFDKVLYVLKNIARDWSAEFHAERDASYGRIVRALMRIREEGSGRKGRKNTRRTNNGDENLNVLVPGCGLARLCLDLVEQGFNVTGNEHSYFMLLMSAFLLNGTAVENQWTIFPWMINSSNVWRLADQVRPCNFPDHFPGDLAGRPESGMLSMVAGEFCECFGGEGERGTYDAVVTCFFLDTAHNVIEYMETIWDVLVAGGVWVHLGPLQWHWSDAHTYLAGSDEISVEVGFDAVVEMATKIGFVVDGFETGEDVGGDEGERQQLERAAPNKHHSQFSRLRVPYMSNPQSMRPQEYDCGCFVARKALEN